MTVFFIIAAALVVVGLVLYLTHRSDTADGNDSNNALQRVPTSGGDDVPTTAEEPEVCCGAHAICEKGLPPEKPVYFDDEELDRFAGRGADGYTPGEVDEFRDVMLTLLPADVVPWTQSIEMRGILLPSQLRDELLMLISDTAS